MKSNNPILQYIIQNKMLDDWSDYGAYMWFASGLSLFNSAVLLVQRPGIGFAASETTWLKDYGRLPKPEARPLLIVKPFAPLDIYYEASDTYSIDNRPLPEWMQNGNRRLLPSMPEFSKEQFIFILNQHGVYFGEKDFGERIYGEMIYQPNVVSIEYLNKNGDLKPLLTHYVMLINSSLDFAQQIPAFFHEIGHLLCGHLTVDEEINKTDFLNCKIPKRDELSHEQEEYEAEMTCALIMKAFGWDYTPDSSIDGINVEKPATYDFGVVLSAADRFLLWLKDTKMTEPVGKYLL